MAFKIVDATALRVGGYIIIEGEVYMIKSMDISKTGKHGHAKCRFEAISIMGLKKKVLVVPGHERFEVPMIDKRNAQVLSVAGDKANLMDSESFENFDLEIPEDLRETVVEGCEVEYWEVEGDKMIRKVF